MHGGFRRWLFYALGGGLGHVTRALALARVAARRGVDCTIVANTPWAPLLAPFLACEPVRFRFLPPEADRTAVGAEIERLLALPWELLVVDTFPRGLGGELAPRLPRLGCPRVLVHRDIDPRYVAARDLRSFVVDHYDLVLAPGEHGPLSDLSHCRRTAPWLVRDDHELAPRSEARRTFGVTGDGPLVVVSAGGRADELEGMRRLARALTKDLQVVFTSLADGGHFPLLERMAGVDAIVGGGGYHTVHEARATGTLLVGIALDRRYDRQARRLAGAPIAADAAGVLRALEAGLVAPRCRMPRYVNGVHDAFAALGALTAAIAG